jgi:hypothetical protein
MRWPATLASVTLALSPGLAGISTARASEAPSVASVVSASAQARPGEAGMSLAELDRLLAPFGDGDVDARRSAAKAVSELGPDATSAIAQKLAELRKTSGAPMQASLRALRAELGAKTNDKTFDLVETLLAQAKGGEGRAAVTEACLLRALGHIGTTPAVRQLVLASSDAGGGFKPEIARIVMLLGERAVPALVEGRRDADQRAWASNMLDALGKRLPGDAVQTKDNQVLSDVLRAYGMTKDLDAIPVILSFVNSDRAQVRAAAREALAAYGQDAIWKLRESYAALTGKPANDAWTAKELAKELFEAYDKFRLQEVYALLDDGLAKQKAGQLEDAASAFDKVLARQPMLDRRADMVPGYLALAQSLEERDRPRALAYLRKALRLDETGPHAAEVESEVLYLEGEDLVARGIADGDIFRRAVTLDPGNARAQAELTRLETQADEKQSRTQRWAAAGAVFALAIAGIVLFGGKRRSPARKPTRAR